MLDFLHEHVEGSGNRFRIQFQRNGEADVDAQRGTDQCAGRNEQRERRKRQSHLFDKHDPEEDRGTVVDEELQGIHVLTDSSQALLKRVTFAKAIARSGRVRPMTSCMMSSGPS